MCVNMRQKVKTSKNTQTECFQLGNFSGSVCIVPEFLRVQLYMYRYLKCLDNSVEFRQHSFCGLNSVSRLYSVFVVVSVCLSSL